MTDKRDPVAILSETNQTRIPELLPIRYQRMAVSPFTFLRGAAAVMVADLAQMPRVGVAVQACGDCHLMNFGAFEIPEDEVLFDINDFDETLPGVDFTVDIKRLVASVAVAALDAGMTDKLAKSIAKSTAQAYREFIGKLAKLAPLEVWHTRMELEREVKLIDDAKLRKKILGTLIKAKKDLAADDNFPHLASTKGGGLRIEDRPPTIYHLDDAADARHTIRARSAFSVYRETLPPERRVLLDRYRLCDLAFKVVGVGSVGTFCAVGLFVTADAEPMFLQIKEAQTSVLERIGGPTAPIPQKVSGWSRASGSCRRPAISFWAGPRTRRRGASFTSAASKTDVWDRLATSSKATRSGLMRRYVAAHWRAPTRARAIPPSSPVIWADPKPWTMLWRASQWPTRSKPSAIMLASRPGWPGTAVKCPKSERSTERAFSKQAMQFAVRYGASASASCPEEEVADGTWASLR